MSTQIKYEDFLLEVSPDLIGFVNEMNDFLLNNDCKIEIKSAKNGYVVSYSYNKRVVFNYVFRKSGMLIRIYADNISKYTDFLETLPESMLKEIEKASVCKRLIDPAKCNSRCPMGLDFTLKGTHYQKCRYGLMFKMNSESTTFIRTFVENEVRERNA